MDICGCAANKCWIYFDWFDRELEREQGSSTIVSAIDT